MKDTLTTLREIEMYVQGGEGEPHIRGLMEQAAELLRNQQEKIQELRKMNSLMDTRLQRQAAVEICLNGDIQ